METKKQVMIVGLGCGIALGFMLGITIAVIYPDTFTAKKVVDKEGTLTDARFIEGGEIQVTILRGLNATTYLVSGTTNNLDLGEIYQIWHYSNNPDGLRHIEKANP